MFCWGVSETLGVVRSISTIGEAPVQFAFWTAVALSDLVVGFLLGFGLITKYALSRNETARQKGAAIRAKLVNYQAPLGLFAMVMGAAYLVWLYVL
jgi:hypothetical protein